MAADSKVVTEVANRLFDAIEKGDAATVGQLWSDDVVVWKVADRDRDKDRALRIITWFLDTTTDRRYEILERRLFDGGFVQQHVLHANGRNGATIAMRVCIVIKVDTDGLIRRIDEYFDPAQIAPLLDATPTPERAT
ncbi:nuclear transport factor 2 family protein [Mycolicibacterium holsaticum]|uniref:nuclear transport factor 2 family protein n=1 Tax=Mycolicibacterium holsaticum TaxID=152142 RepID=UPI001C7D86B6|nr:nuclear transport factor 2 family protein [Mycolicibacterium holsaticum]MDA4107386.1 ketosteroid isomerase [Mycolicibacterium holsaticum DSM 44478 = JCM 12374]QZA11215.1 nuclear transport factor 2 family protein [Mycolicibacterium holsaticum DSM 44478 = JCM 12374]UNC11291.1 nuclear transport factor 2 family protein [Mycolicibacterium holsaticum DSM 44478 = JCM 12374]